MILDIEQKINNYPGSQGTVQDSLVNLVTGNLSYAVEFPGAGIENVEDNKKLRKTLQMLSSHNHYVLGDDSTEDYIVLNNISGGSTYTDFMQVDFLTTSSNNGPVTIKVNNGPVVPVRKILRDNAGDFDGFADLEQGDIKEFTHVKLIYSNGNNIFVMIKEEASAGGSGGESAYYTGSDEIMVSDTDSFIRAIDSINSKILKYPVDIYLADGTYDVSDVSDINIFYVQPSIGEGGALSIYSESGDPENVTIYGRGSLIYAFSDVAFEGITLDISCQAYKAACNFSNCIIKSTDNSDSAYALNYYSARDVSIDSCIFKTENAAGSIFAVNSYITYEDSSVETNGDYNGSYDILLKKSTMTLVNPSAALSDQRFIYGELSVIDFVSSIKTSISNTSGYELLVLQSCHVHGSRGDMSLKFGPTSKMILANNSNINMEGSFPATVGDGEATFMEVNNSTVTLVGMDMTPGAILVQATGGSKVTLGQVTMSGDSTQQINIDGFSVVDCRFVTYDGDGDAVSAYSTAGDSLELDNLSKYGLVLYSAAGGE